MGLMKASELVAKLSALIAEHGDLYVGYSEDEYDEEWGWVETKHHSISNVTHTKDRFRSISFFEIETEY